MTSWNGRKSAYTVKCPVCGAEPTKPCIFPEEERAGLYLAEYGPFNANHDERSN